MELIMETERMELRKMTFDDLDDLMLIFSDPIVMEHYGSTYTRSQASRIVEWNLNNYKQYNHGLWVCTLDNQLVGICGITPHTVNDKVELEIGLLFVRKFWGNGLASEAVQACIDYGFKNLNAKRLIILINKANTPAIELAKRVGMSFDEELEIDNVLTHVYAINRVP